MGKIYAELLSPGYKIALGDTLWFLGLGAAFRGAHVAVLGIMLCLGTNAAGPRLTARGANCAPGRSITHENNRIAYNIMWKVGFRTCYFHHWKINNSDYSQTLR